jgi:ribose/xylose/arabinose/galactoside ABC-type transport system permease subunit
MTTQSVVNQDSDLSTQGIGIGMRAVRFVGQNGLLVMLALVILIFASLNKTFLTVDNFKNLLSQNAALFVVAVGMTFAIISRNIDLSPGSLVALTCVFIALTFQATGNMLLGIVVGFAAAILIELLNGFLVARVGLNALIVTLATWIWARGLAIGLTKADSIVVRDPVIDFINGPGLLGIGPPIIIVLVTYLTGWFLLNRTTLGRYTYAIGSDERAAIRAGIDTALYKILVFGLMGVMVGIASVLTLSRLGAAAPAATYGLELDAIVAVIIGGNSFQGGEGGLGRTFLGALFIAVLNNGLNNLGMRDSYFYMYKGVAIVVALLFGVVGQRLFKRI